MPPPVHRTLYCNRLLSLLISAAAQGARRSGWYRSRRARSRWTIWATDTDGQKCTARAPGQPRGEGKEGFCGQHQEGSTELEVYQACLRAHVMRGSGGMDRDRGKRQSSITPGQRLRGTDGSREGGIAFWLERPVGRTH